MSNENSVRLDLFDLLAAARTRHDRFANEARRVDSAEIYSLLNSHPGKTSDVVAEIDSIRMGLHACDIARDMLLLGDVERREHWLSVAADSGIEEAGWQQYEWDADAPQPGHNTDIDADSVERVGEDVLLQALIRAKDAAEAALEDSEARFEEIFSSSSVGMAISDVDGRLVRTNRALAEILGHRRGQVTAERLEELFHPEDAEYLKLRYQVLLEDGTLPFREQRRLVRTDGEEPLVYLSASVLRDPDGTARYFVTSAEDVSEKAFLVGQLQFQTIHDALTGLANRDRFQDRLEEALRGEHRIEDLTVFHLNLDGFRAINNGVGRDAGDRLLQSVATKLRRVFENESVMIARFDGDEFGVLVQNRPGTPTVAVLAARINDELAEPIYIGEEGIATTATIAVAHRLPRDMVVAELLRATDTTLRRLKASGRRQWGMVDLEANERDRARFALAASVPGAWESGEIGIDYQPLVAVADKRVTAVQALLRWDHTTDGLLHHARCIEVLGETGLSLSVGRWMLREACVQVRSWSDRSSSAPKLYVELSRELAGDPDLVTTVRSVLADTQFEQDQLQLGMPAQALCMIDGIAEDNLDVLVHLGMSVVLYGFGTTRGDLACLEDLPVRAVKMSDNVVSRVDRMGEAALFTKSIRQLVPLVRESGTPVIVGDISTEAQFEWWCEAGADIVQGDYTRSTYAPNTSRQVFVA